MGFFYQFSIETVSPFRFGSGSGQVSYGFDFAADLIASQFFVKKYGGSKWGERMAAIGVIIGSFVYPPFGVILVPFLLVFVTELMSAKNARHAFMVAIASLFAFLSSTFAKFVVQLLLIVWFVIEVLV